MIIVLLAALITIALTLKTVTGRRFLGGQLLDPNLDQFNRSTFFTGDPTGVSPWTRAPVIHRIGIRVGCIALLVLYIIGLITHPTATAAICAAIVILWLAWAARSTWQWFTTRNLRKNVIRPLFDGLKQTVGWDDGIKPADVILAGNDYHQTGITLNL